MGEKTAERPIKRTLVELHIDDDDAAWDLVRDLARRRRGEADESPDADEDEESDEGRSIRSRLKRLLVGVVAVNVLAAVAYLVYRLRFAGGEEDADDADAEPLEEPAFETELGDDSGEDGGFAPIAAPDRSGTASLVGLCFLVAITLVRRRYAGPDDDATFSDE